MGQKKLQTIRVRCPADNCDWISGGWLKRGEAEARAKYATHYKQEHWPVPEPIVEKTGKVRVYIFDG